MKESFVLAFNKWMDEYINDPEAFQETYKTALNHCKEKLEGKEPSYGEVAAEQFIKYLPVQKEEL